MNLDHRGWGLILMLGLLTGCRERAPEKPTEPPTPTTTATAQASEPPAFASRITTGGVASEYQAYFEGDRLASIDERYVDRPLQARYEYDGARLSRYSTTASGEAAGIEVSLDSQGRVESATNNGQPLAPEQLEEIRTRAQTLRSHALAQQASRQHRTY